MFCSQCGTENRNDRKFCSQCGAKLPDYTKPREDLVMPEEVNAKHAESVKIKQSIRTLHISMWIMFVLGAVAIVVSFFFKDIPQLVCASIGLVFLIVFFILALVKDHYYKKQRKLNQNK